MPLKNKNIQDSCFIFLFGAALLWYSLSEHYGGPRVEWKMSPFLFPLLVSVFLLLLSASLFFDGLRELKDRKGGVPAAGKAGGPVKIGLVPVTIALAVGYFILMRLITFIPATILFLACFVFVLGERNWRLIAPIALIGSLAIYAIFGLALNVMLP
jgi:hypothetical protein